MKKIKLSAGILGIMGAALSIANHPMAKPVLLSAACLALMMVFNAWRIERNRRAQEFARRMNPFFGLDADEVARRVASMLPK